MAWLVFRWLEWLVICLYLLFIEVIGAVDIVRLPDAVFPLRYEVTLLPVIEETPRVCGRVWIDLAVKNSTNEVVLHALNLKISRIVLRELRNDSVATETDASIVEEACFVTGVEEENLFSPEQNDLVDSFFLDRQSEQMIVKSKETLQPGNNYRIGVSYVADIQDDEIRGFFRIKYTRDENDGDRWIGGTQLEAIHARSVFPCFDEPAFKATFQLTVGHSRNYKALSNMPAISTFEFQTTGKWVWSAFSETPPMATYLVACVITDLDYTETIHHSISGRNVTIRLWSHGHRLEQLEFPKHLIPKVLARLERHTRVPYNLPKLDIVAVPQHESFRAMENWGLILHSESNILLTESDESNPALHKAIMATTIVHELAHQWFGNLVTWHWWDNVWLNEGLATFYENLILNEVAAEVNQDMVLILFHVQCITNDRIGRTVALNAPLEIFPTIENKFDAFAYLKGGALFRMVRSFVGHDAFQTAVYRYVNKFQFRNANSTDLWTLMNQEARRTQMISDRMSVARIMNSWTQQTGFPLITVVRNSNGTIRINQTAFHDGIYPLTEDISSKFWWVPVNVVTAEEQSFGPKDRRLVAWLTPKKPWIEIQAPKSNFSWVVINPELTGYCRVNYDEWLWRLISQQLMRNHTVIPPVTRAQLIDDAFALGHAKVISFDVAMHLIEYMAYVDEVGYVRNAASVHVNRLLSMVSVNGVVPDNTSILGSIVLRMYSIISDSKSQVSQSRSSMQHLFDDGPCGSNNEFCIAEALRLYRNMMAGSSLARDSNQKIMSDYVESAWCTALRYGDQKDWEFAWNRVNTDGIDIMEQKLMIKAMACSRNPQHVNQLLSRMFHPAFSQTPRESSLIIRQLSQNSPIRPVVVKFVFRNLDFILKHFRKSSDFSDTMMSLIKRFYTEEEKRQFKVLVLEHASELGAENTQLLARVLDFQ